ncbi:GAF domain-containing protein, partial [bacterium]|nr:GAF domain-containing protein [bacterium]
APYILRVELLLTILFFAALLLFSRYGFGTNGGAVLLAYILFAIILFDVRIGLRAALLSLLMIGALAFAFKTETIAQPASVRTLSLTATRDWVEYSLPLVLITGLTASAIGSLLKGLATNLAQARTLSARLQEEQKKLDNLLSEGSSRLERRELQLRSASQISRDFSTVMDPKLLLTQVVNSIRENFDLYYVGIFLVDEDGRYAVLRAGTGDAGEKMLTAGHSLEIGGASMIGWCVSNRSARIALDVGAEQVHFNNPYLPMTRSEMALPVVFQDRALGALTIQSVEPSAFVNEDIMILQGIADSLAIALENAQLFQRTQQALEELRLFNQAYVQDTWGHTLASQGELAFTFQNQAGNLPEGDAHLLTIPVTLREEKIGEINLETTGDTLNA